MIRGLIVDLDSGHKRPSVLVLLVSFGRARTLAAVLFRLSQALGRVSPALADAVKQFNQFATGADVAWQARIGPGLTLYHPQGVVIGPGVVMGARAQVQQGVTVGTKRPGDSAAENSPTIGDDCLLGAGSRVIGPITLGDGVTVGANCVCSIEVPSGATVLGIPGRIRVPRSGPPAGADVEAETQDVHDQR